MELDAFASASLEALQPGTPDAAAMKAALEAATSDVVASLRANGLAFEPDGLPGQLGFRASFADGRVLSLVVTAGVGVAVAFRDAAEQKGVDAPSEAEQRFYAALERARLRAGALGFDALAPHEQVVFALGGLEAEIANGGFDQYFLNPAGDHARLALDALAMLDASAARRVVLQACKPFGKEGPPRDRDARIAAMHSMPERQQGAWDRLSVQYFARGEFLPELVDARFLRTVPGWGHEAAGLADRDMPAYNPR